MNHSNHASRIGDRVAPVVGRTDEGTPISLADLEGRALAVFLCRDWDDRKVATLIEDLSGHLEDFMSLDCSPILVIREGTDALAKRRSKTDPPFLMISDGRGTIHESLSPPGLSPGAWLIDSSGILTASIPQISIVEMVGAVLAALIRTRSKPSTPAGD